MTEAEAPAGDLHGAPGSRPGSMARRALRGLASVALLAAIFGFAIPRMAGGGYAEVTGVWARLGVPTLALLGVVWLSGLWVYAFAARVCLSGLSHTRAMVMSLAGSCVSNVAPFGGALGIGTNYLIAGSWGYTTSAISTQVLVTGLSNFYATLALPVLGLVLFTVGGRASAPLVISAGAGVAVMVATFVFLAMIERNEKVAASLGATGERFANAVLARVHVHRTVHWQDQLLEFRHGTSSVVRARWRQLVVILAAYKGLQFILFWLCVRVTDPGSPLSWVDVFVAFAFGRVLSTVPVTPAGTGVVEAGSIAGLVALGGDQAASAAAVLLFSGYVYLMEIPLGGAAWVAWSLGRRWRRPRGEKEVSP